MFSSTQDNVIKREMVANYLQLSQVHDLPAHACAQEPNLLANVNI